MITKSKGVGQGKGGGQKPIVLDQMQIDKIEVWAGLLTIQQIGSLLGFCENTFTAIRKRQPKVDEVYQKGRSDQILAVAGSLVEGALKGDTTSKIFYLKTQAGWKETQVNENTHTITGLAELLSGLNKKTS